MSEIYCLNCGKGTSYSLRTPSFCCYCGQSFQGSSSNASSATAVTAPPTPAPQPAPAPTRPRKTVPPRQPQLEASTDVEDDDFIPTPENVTSLDIEIVAPPQRKMTVADLVASGGPVGDEPLNREKPPKMSKKKFLEEFAREAGASRPGKRRSHKIAD